VTGLRVTQGTGTGTSSSIVISHCNPEGGIMTLLPHTLMMSDV
jgi:hypothetical protein